MRIVKDPVAVPTEDTLRMPVMQLDSLLGRTRGDEEPVFLLVRRRDPVLYPLSIPKRPLVSSSVSIVLLVALVLGIALLWALR
jgi:hypothetical protein